MAPRLAANFPKLIFICALLPPASPAGSELNVLGRGGATAERRKKSRRGVEEEVKR
jgi:hypothetical protein